MSNSEQATHRHKRVGDVVLLRSTSELAEILTSTGGQKFWVKLADLSELPKNAEQGPASKKRRSAKRRSHVQ